MNLICMHRLYKHFLHVHSIKSHNVNIYRDILGIYLEKMTLWCILIGCMCKKVLPRRCIDYY
jgi:hypothetical protein